MLIDKQKFLKEIAIEKHECELAYPFNKEYLSGISEGFRLAKVIANSESVKPPANTARQARKASTKICPFCKGTKLHSSGMRNSDIPYSECTCVHCNGTGKLLPC